MINVSNEFKKLNIGEDKRDYLEYVDITLKNGTVLNLTNKDLWNGGLSFEDAVSSDSSFDIGGAIINKSTLTINNIYDEYSDYVFEDAEVVAYVGLPLDVVDETVGRNLVANSKEISVTRNDATNSWIAEKIPFFMHTDYGFEQIQQGGQFTLSFDYEITGITTARKIYIGLKYTSSSYADLEKTIELSAGDNTGHFEHTFTPTSAQMQYGVGWILSGFGAGLNAGAVVTLRNIKLEKGNIATKYTIAPEDIRIEKIRKGTYAVDEPSYNDSIITLSCLDNMRKFDRSYSESTLAYPATLNTIVRDACSVCGVTLQTVNFPHDDFIIQTRPSNEAVTFREVISWVAQIAGCFCRCDAYGRLELKWYNQTALENPKVVDWSAEENILLDSGKTVSTTNYMINQYSVAREVAANTEYTVVVKAKIPLDHILRIYIGTSSLSAGGFVGTGQDEVYYAQLTTPASDLVGQWVKFYNSVLGAYENDGSEGTIYWACLYEGHIEAPEHWSASYAEENSHWIKSNYSAPVVSLDDVVITGVRVVEKNESEDAEEQLTTYQAGTDGYVISIENNELIKGGAGQTVAGWLGEQLIGVKFRKATVNHASDPTIEAGDIAVVTDRKGNNYNIVVSSTKFSTGSSQNTVSAAENPARNSAARYSAQTKNYVEWRNAIEKEKTEREKALDDLADRLANSPGVFTTVQTQSDGSKVYYLHNKPNLSESDMVWKMTAESWGVSTDGGKTWNAGMTVDGDTIVRILTATGVNADWINAGAITVKDSSGNIIFSVDMDTKQVIISGDSVRIGGKPATTALNDILAESKDYSDGKLADYANTVTQNITNLQAQIDGQIETFYYDYEPTLQNIPASEWTTTEERQKHEGDLFFWKSKGYAYRFLQDGATWKWQLVQDTDITQAMAAAEKAQDTADGKRRVFVVTPQPPYDIGDLWCNGTDILTCAVARAQGSVYVSSDWQKLNKYTDDSFAQQVQDELNNLQIGGTQILRGTNTVTVLTSSGEWANGTWRASSYGTGDRKSISVTDSPNPSISLGWELTQSTSFVGIAQGNVPVTNGQTYTMSCYARGTGGLFLEYGKSPYPSKSYTLSNVTSWTKYSFTFTIGEKSDGSTDGSTNIYFENGANGTLQICGMKLETGNKAGDWAPAPEDTETYADNLAADLQTQIDGKIETYNQTADPSTAWTTTALKTQHTGDLWYNPTSKETKRWSGTAWIKLENKEAEEAGELAQKKAQVFTTTPTVPYYIGDLWFNSATSDIMTCTTSRTTGSYTASDWAKRNKYTDDTVANQALTEAQNARNLNIILDNEYQGIPTDYDGNYTTFPTCQTFVQVLYGHTDVSTSCTYTTSKSSGVTGTWNNTTRTYTVTGLTTDNGWVDITASYLNLFTTTKRFNIAKVKDGSPGINGADGTSIAGYTIDYQASTSGTTAPTGTWSTTIPNVSAGQYLWTRVIYQYSDGTSGEPVYSVGMMGQRGLQGLQGEQGEQGIQGPAGADGKDGVAGRSYILDASDTAIKKGADNVLSPASVTFSSYCRDGSSATRTAYAGRFKIEESTDGTTFTAKYTSSANESSKVYTPSSSDVKVIRCTLYAAGGTTSALDSQSVIVLTDVSNLEVGGRNLFDYATSGGNTSVSEDKDTVYINAFTNDTYFGLWVFEDFEEGQQYTLSCEVSGFESDDVAWRFPMFAQGNPAKAYIQLKNGKCICTFTCPSAYAGQKRLFLDDDLGRPTTQTARVTITKIKIEKGNTATDWTPAPEDQETLVVTLSNEAHTITTDKSGNGGSFTDCLTTVQVYSGTQNVTVDATYTVTKSTGVTGAWDATNHKYSVTALSTDNGYVDIKVVYNGITVTKRFTISKSKTGADGAAGADGKTTYFHIKYSAVSNPTSASQMTETPDIYIGTYVDYTASDSTDPSKYTWARFQGLQGETGEQGIPGTNGTNGKTSYLHIKYSNDGGKTFTDNNGETPGDYIGQYVDFTQADSSNVGSYTWTKVKGDTGEQGTQGINLLPNTKTMSGYIKSDNVTLTPDGEGFTVGTFAQVTTPAWNRIDTRNPIPFSTVRGKTVTFSLKVRSDDWEALNADTTHGLNIIFALCTATSTTRTLYAGKAFYSKALSDGWQKITLTATLSDTYFSSGTGTIDDDTRIYMEAYNYSVYSMQVKQFKLELGNVSEPVWTPAIEDLQGADGIGIKSSAVTYQASTSGTTAPTGTWSTTIPTVSAGQFLWTRTVITYTDNTTSTLYSVGRSGTNGANGAAGKGISSITNYYLATASGSGVTTATTGWTTTIQTITATNKYLWNYEVVKYTDNTTTTTSPVIIGAYGDKGATGAAGSAGRGISSITEYYLVSSSASGITTSTSGWSTSIVSTTTTNKYLWNYEKITYTDNTSVNTTPKIIGTHGATGATGAAGRTYFMEPSTLVVKQSQDNSMAPNYITLSAYYRDGTTTARTAYAGRFKIEESLDGANWTTVYTSSANESSVTHSLYSALATSAGGVITTASGNVISIPRDIVALRCTLYAAGGTTQMLDMQSIAVVVDVDALTHEQIFNLLTNNGEMEGIFQEGNQLYINGTYIKVEDLYALNATIAGWNITNKAIYKDVTASDGAVYRVYFQPPLLSSPTSTWVLSCQKSTDGGKTFTGNFILYSNGDARFGETYIYANGDARFGETYVYANGTIKLGSTYIYSDGSAKFGSGLQISKDGVITSISDNGRCIVDGSSVKLLSPDSSSSYNEWVLSVDEDSFFNLTSFKGKDIFLKAGLTDTDGKTKLFAEVPFVTENYLRCNGFSYFYGKSTFYGDIAVSGTKPRIVDTLSYGEKLLYCYEMPSPMFGDIGEAETDEEGKCVISLDDVFSETISLQIEYQVFLQKEGQGDLWVDSKETSYFVVKGTPNLKFAWEIKAIQRDYELERLEEFSDEKKEELIDYEQEYQNEIEELVDENEEVLYETA